MVKSLKNFASRFGWLSLITAVLFLSSCGYTTQSLLPADIRSVYVAPVTNAISLSSEISQKETFRVYRPGIEVDLTNAIINRFIFDGNLKVAKEDKADAVIEGRLVDYRRDPLRYSEGEDIQEYRLSIQMDVVMTRVSDKKIIWRDESLTGDTTFFLAGPHAVSEDIAAVKAVEDVARRVVEKTVELW